VHVLLRLREDHEAATGQSHPSHSSGRPRLAFGLLPSAVHVVRGCRPVRPSRKVCAHLAAGEPATAAPVAWHPPCSRASVGLKSRSGNHSPNTHLAPSTVSRKHRSQNGYGVGPEYSAPQQTQSPTVSFNFFTPSCWPRPQRGRAEELRTPHVEIGRRCHAADSDSLFDQRRAR
jgi:hypothetical protein